MNWEAMGAVGDLIGGLAVVATLIYLALQVRQSKELLMRNEKIALSQVYQSRADARMSMHLAQAQNGADLVQGVWGQPEGVDELNDRDRMTVRQFMLAAYVHQDNVIFQASLGLIDDVSMQAAAVAVKLNFPVWEKLDVLISPRVIDFYNTIPKNQGDE